MLDRLDEFLPADALEEEEVGGLGSSRPGHGRRVVRRRKYDELGVRQGFPVFADQLKRIAVQDRHIQKHVIGPVLLGERERAGGVVGFSNDGHGGPGQHRP